MTVQELIHELLKYPKDKRVYNDHIQETLSGEIVLTHNYTDEEERNMAEGLDDCSREDLLGLIEFYKQALEVQGKTVRQLVIAKACRWLAHNAHEYLDADNGYDAYKMIEEFQKAMYK